MASKTLYDQLTAPFAEADIEWRIGRATKRQDGSVTATALAYLTARAVADRLDQVVGPENWQVRYEAGTGFGEGVGVLAGIAIRWQGGDWVWKWDGAEQSDIESFKGGLSGAFKRAAVAWGVGRYLYGLGTSWAHIHAEKAPGCQYGKTKDGTVFWWTPPHLPGWALPAETVNRETGEVTPQGGEGPPDKDDDLFGPLPLSQPGKDDPGSFLMPAGEYKGRPLREVPIANLEAALEHPSMARELRFQVAGHAYLDHQVASAEEPTP